MRRLTAVLCLLAVATVSSFAHPPVSPQKNTTVPIPQIIPQPASITAGKGSFTLGPSTVIVYHTANAEVQRSVLALATALRSGTGLPLTVVDAARMPTKDYIFFNYLREEGLGREGYRLEVRKDRVLLEANNDPGFFYGVQTVLQLLPPEIFAQNAPGTKNWSMPCVTITDSPRYTWRGQMLDVSRHFFPKEYVKRFIDIIAMHKMNTFHWHLTDDQGWRVEIKKYPQLTAVSAWRVDHEDIHWVARPDQRPGEAARYGGYYTQDDIREVVAYAAERYVTVVPEIELPAHATAVLAAFPEFSCTGGPFTTPSGSIWPITDIFCGGNDAVFTFLEDVFREVVPLFPGPFIHIGGDEADKKEWKRCPKCQARIKAEGLADETELQSYFIKRVENFIAGMGKRVIGWDEIVEGGLPPRASVMSWRGTKGGIEAARHGHDVVMTPTSHCYLDYYQNLPHLEPLAIGGYLPLETVYLYEPTPAELTPEEAKHILGVQGNLWTEYVSEGSHAEYMALPRMAAIAEAGWTPKELRSWPSFLDRLEAQFARYDARRINAARSIYAVVVADSFDTASWTRIVRLSNQSGRGEIRYTLDGSEPTRTSPLYTRPFTLATTKVLKAAAFRNGTPLAPVTTQALSVTSVRGMTAQITPAAAGEGDAASGVLLVDHTRAPWLTDAPFWTRWKGTDATITLDLGKTVPVQRVVAGFFHETVRLIFPPTRVDVSVSTDGTSFTPAGSVAMVSPVKDPRPVVRDYAVTLGGVSARFIRLTAAGVGPAPAWHKLANEPTWLYADEIIVE